MIGRKGYETGEWAIWTAGDKYSFATLNTAYVEWQKTVKSPVAPMPTKSGTLGEILTKAGLILRRTAANNLRELPPVEVCLEALCKA